MKKYIASLGLIALLSTTGANAAANSNTGCGLGSFLIDANSIVLHILQITTNGTFSNQTFGITTGTLGCKKTKIVLDERIQEFVAANIDSLSKEISIGRGETVDALAELMKVEDKALFAHTLQSNYNAIFASKDSQTNDVLDSIATM